jgi:ribA/ribD-fused uncharacterized protein
MWTTVEHAYQAFKTDNKEDQEAIRLTKSPGKAKRMGAKVTLRETFHEHKVQLMKILIKCKFVQNPEVTELLLATGFCDIVEVNTWHDQFWGACYCTLCEDNGDENQNTLGKILVEVRTELRELKEFYDET